MKTPRTANAFRQNRSALPEPQRTKLRALIAARGFQRAAILLRSSDEVLLNLSSGGFALPSTVQRIAEAVDRAELSKAS